MSDLIKIMGQLDTTRLALNRNLESLDEDLKETYQEFYKEVLELEKLLLVIDRPSLPIDERTI